MSSPDFVKSLTAALNEAAEAAKTHGERLVSESESIFALGERLLAQAAQLRAGATALNVPQEAEAALVPQPPPPEPVVKPDEPKSVAKGGGVVTLARATDKMRELGRASRFVLARELGLTPIAVSRWLRQMEAAGTIRAEGAEFIFVDKPQEAEPQEAEPQPEPDRTARLPRTTREDFPEHLQMFPAAQGISGNYNQRLTAAEGQKAVYDVVTDGRPDVIAAEIAESTGLLPARVSDYLRLMDEAGLVRRTGRNRHRRDRPSGMPGRASVEYTTVDQPDRVRIAEPEPVESTRDDAAVLPEPSINDVRVVKDVVKKQLTMFSPAQIADATDLDKEIVLACLRELERHGVVADESPAPDLPLFRHTPNGRTAERERVVSSPPRGATTPIRTDRGEVVAGTGKKLKAANAEVQELIDACIRAGATVTHATSGHFAVQPPEGKRILIAGTPRGTRTVMNDRARLRRAGLAV